MLLSQSNFFVEGVILYECCTGKQPFMAQNEGALIRKILRGQYPPPQSCSQQLAAALTKCLTYDYNKRPNAGGIMAGKSLRNQWSTSGNSSNKVQNV